ncbi:glycosyltransferase family 2 protein [Desulfobaculum sp. SPO524]|uniref:glycosyltransferase family 2 protein n=1 Tax=Desulfobaculum sp. SPO524 TaxID=3378071 RepID=UPI0038528E0A
MAQIIDITPRARDVHPVLMLITSHRMDCFVLCLKCLELYTDLSRFKKIYILANDVSDEHSLLIKSFQQRHPGVIDVYTTPRGYVPAVVAMQNIIMARHIDDVIIKMYEDVFVTPRWLERLIAAYKMHKNHPRVVLASTVAPVSVTGRQVMDRALRAHYQRERSRLPGTSVAHNAILHRFVWEKVLFDGFEEKFLNLKRPEFSYVPRLSTECIIYDRRLMDLILPMPLRTVQGNHRVEEYIINSALASQKLQAAVITNAVVHHFSHMESEAYLRRHISMDDIWWHMTFLDENPAYKDSNDLSPRLPGTRNLKLRKLMRDRELRLLS